MNLVSTTDQANALLYVICICSILFKWLNFMQSTIGSLYTYYTYSFVVSLPDIAMLLFYSFDYLSSDLVLDHSDSLAST
jgi:hypothetical protein